MKNIFSRGFWNDLQIQSLIGAILRIGVLTSSVIVLLGGIIYLARHGGATPQYTAFKDRSAQYGNLHTLLHEAAGMHGRDIIQLGLMVLIATPIARILFSAIGFMLEKDYLYIGICLLVLGIIAFSMFHNIAG